MKPEKLISFFQSSGLVTGQKAEEIASCFTAHAISRNEYLLKADTICNEYLFLEKGFMRAFALDPEGRDVTTNFFAGNQVVFEPSSFFNRTKSQESIQALTDCEGWMITYDQLNHLFHALPEFREFGRHILVRGLVSLKARMLSMITQTGEERYENLLHNKPEIFQHAPLKHIASYLGITDTSLSRIRKEFSKK